MLFLPWPPSPGGRQGPGGLVLGWSDTPQPSGSLHPARLPAGARFGGWRRSPSLQRPSYSFSLGKGMDPGPGAPAQGCSLRTACSSSGDLGSRSQDCSCPCVCAWVCFIVWLQSPSPSLPSLAVVPLLMDDWNKGSLCCPHLK